MIKNGSMHAHKESFDRTGYLVVCPACAATIDLVDDNITISSRKCANPDCDEIYTPRNTKQFFHDKYCATSNWVRRGYMLERPILKDGEWTNLIWSGRPDKNYKRSEPND